MPCSTHSLQKNARAISSTQDMRPLKMNML
jgi:hypothetical protein